MAKLLDCLRIGTNANTGLGRISNGHIKCVVISYLNLKPVAISPVYKHIQLLLIIVVCFVLIAFCD